MPGRTSVFEGEGGREAILYGRGQWENLTGCVVWTVKTCPLRRLCFDTLLSQREEATDASTSKLETAHNSQ